MLIRTSEAALMRTSLLLCDQNFPGAYKDLAKKVLMVTSGNKHNENITTSTNINKNFKMNRIMIHKFHFTVYEHMILSNCLSVCYAIFLM